MVNLRYRQSRDVADQLGQVLTPRPIAEMLAASLPTHQQRIRHVVDLGAGKGALSLAVLARHKHAKALLLEIDSQYAEWLSSFMPGRSTVVCADALGFAWMYRSAPDVILSNPPYGTIAVSAEVKEILRLSGLQVPTRGKWVRGDAAFVARAWNIAKCGSNLGLIVASPMIRDNAFRQLRKRLVGELRELCVTQLHERTFPHAEVRAFALTGQRAANRRRNVLLRKALADGSIVDEMEVGFGAAVVSLDIDFHRALERLGMSGASITETLGSIGTSIVRGSRSQRDYERLGLSAFHTTDFSDSVDEIILRGAPEGFQLARPGDILIPRVGSRCLVRQAHVRDGTGLFTDCIFRLAVESRARSRVWKTLSSSFGADWRIANATGSCAKHLTVQTLLSMPLLD